MTVYSVAIMGTVLGQQQVHQRYYESAGGSADFQGFADGLADLITVPMQAVTTTATSYTHLIIRPVTEGSIGSVVVPDGWPFSGLQATETLPPFVTARLKLFAAGTQHPVRGMVQLSGLSELQVADGQIALASLSLFTTLVSAFGQTVAISGSESWVPVLWSDTYQRSAPITGVLASRALGTQRRRMAGSGS